MVIDIMCLYSKQLHCIFGVPSIVIRILCNADLKKKNLKCTDFEKRTLNCLLFALILFSKKPNELSSTLGTFLKLYGCIDGGSIKTEMCFTRLHAGVGSSLKQID